MIGGVSSEIIACDVILFVLLQDLHAVEFIFARLKRLNEPRAIVGAVAKNLADDALVLAARVRFLDKGAAGKVGVRRQSVIEGRGPERSEEADQQQREKQSRQADSCGQHRDDFVRARHAAQTKEQREQQRDGQKNHEDLRYLREVIMKHQHEAARAHRGKWRCCR